MDFRSKGISVDGKLFENQLYFINWILVVVQLLSHVWLFPTPWTAACQASLSFTISQGLLKFTSIESVMLSNHLILCHSLLLCLQAFPASWSFPMSRLFTSCSQRVCVCMYSLLLKYFGYLCISVHINLTFYWLHNIPLCEKTIVYLTN